MNKQRIVVLGGTGFVGRHMISRLTADGHSITLLSRNPNSHSSRFLPPAVAIKTVNVYDKDKLVAAFSGADVIINLVGILNERGDNGRGFQRAHVELTQTVIDACQQSDVKRLLHMSALNAGRGHSYYLKSRGEAEKRVKGSGLDWTIFQPSVIFGVDDGFFNRFAQLLKLTMVLPLARAKARFAPVYIGDVVEAFVNSLDQEKTIGRIYELYGPNIFSLYRIVRLTAAQLHLRRFVLPLPDFLGRIQAWVCDWIPGKPFSSDNYRSLLTDSVGSVDGLHQLGIKPTSVEQVLPEILDVYNHRQRRLDLYRAGH